MSTSPAKSNQSPSRILAKATTPRRSMVIKRAMMGTILSGMVALTPSQAETLTNSFVDSYQSNPQLLAERSNFRVAAERLGQAQNQLFPTATMSGSTSWQKQETDSFSLNSRPSQVTATVTQPLFKSAVFFGLSAAYDSVKSARQKLALAEGNSLLAAATAYFNLLQDRATLDLQESNLRVLTAQLESVEAQFHIGQLTITDVAQAQAAKANALSAKLSAESNLAINRGVYFQVVGRLPDDSTKAEDNIPDALLPKTIDEVTDLALRRNPSILAAQYDENVARTGVGVAAGDLLPSVNLVGSYAVQRAASLGLVGFPMKTTNVGQVMIQVTVPIYDSGNSFSKIRQSRQTANAARLGADAAQRAGVQNAVMAFQQLTSSRAQLTALEAAIKSNTIALQGVKRKQEVGSLTILDVLNAQQTLLNSQVQMIQTRRNALVASYQLLLATGGLTAQSLGLPVEFYDADYYEDKASWKFFGFGDPVPDATHP